MSPHHHSLVLRLAPVFFVLLWSTGWIVARASVDHADPLTFLAVRFLLAGTVLAVIAVAAGAKWPRGRHMAHALVSGIFLHAIYLGGVWWAIRHGLPAVISGLLAAIQPIATALLAPMFLGEHINRRQWIGIALGFFGMSAVLAPKLQSLGLDALTADIILIGMNIIGMLSATIGSFYQKRFIPSSDLRTLSVLQYCGAFLIVLPAAYLLEPMHIEWTGTMIIVMAWSVLAISVGAIGLWLFLIREGEVSRAAALIYLIPPTVAIESFYLFGEQLTLVQAVGMGLSVLGVALTIKR
jgi:drug/metabolite transporter (DMT)-like permease